MQNAILTSTTCIGNNNGRYEQTKFVKLLECEICITLKKRARLSHIRGNLPIETSFFSIHFHGTN